MALSLPSIICISQSFHYSGQSTAWCNQVPATPVEKRLSSHLAALTLILKKGGKTIETICLDFKELGRESSNLGQVGIRSTWEISEKTPVPQWSLSLKPPTPTPQRGSLKREAPC